jgi:hypothetical protein
MTEITITAKGVKALDDPHFKHLILTAIQRWTAQGMVK